MRDQQRLKAFHDAKGIPNDLARKQLFDMRERRRVELEQLGATKREMTKYWSDVKKSASGASEPETKTAFEGRLGVHRKLVARKLTAPKVSGIVGALRLGSIFSDGPPAV